MGCQIADVKTLFSKFFCTNYKGVKRVNDAHQSSARTRVWFINYVQKIYRYKILIMKWNASNIFYFVRNTRIICSRRIMSNLSARQSVNQSAYPTPRQFYIFQFTKTYLPPRSLSQKPQQEAAVSRFRAQLMLAVDTAHRKILRKLTLRGTSI